MDYRNVLTFWFEETDSRQRFSKSADFDRQLTERFSQTLSACFAGECWRWRRTVEGRLAEIVVLDQFSRNIHRNTPLAFASDPMALALAQEVVLRGEDGNLAPERRAFVYMPYMHSESKPVHEEAVRLFDLPGIESGYEYELKHKAIIDRFGRYPHRNAILGRVSTPEEIEFLSQPDSSF